MRKGRMDVNSHCKIVGIDCRNGVEELGNG